MTRSLMCFAIDRVQLFCLSVAREIVQAYPPLKCPALTGFDLSQYSSSLEIVSSFLLNSKVKVRLGYAQRMTGSRHFEGSIRFP